MLAKKSSRTPTPAVTKKEAREAVMLKELNPQLTKSRKRVSCVCVCVCVCVCDT